MAHATAAVLLAATGVLISGIVGASPGHADDADSTIKPDVYNGRASASSIHFFFDRTPGLFPLADLFHVELPYATSVLTSSGDISATSASIYPGDGILGAPGLICGQLTKCPFSFPQYPLIAKASYPNTPDAQAEASIGTQSLGGILTDKPHTITAHADDSAVDAFSTVSSSSLLDVLTADTLTSHTTQGFKNGAMVLTATSDVAGLNLLGGALTIDGIHSEATSTVGAGSAPTATVTTTITGATLAGMPISIASDGIHLAVQSTPALTDALNGALAQLKAAGLTIRLTAADKTISGGSVAASTSGLFIGFAETLPDLPLPTGSLPLPVAIPGTGGDYVGSISIGGAGVTSYASGTSTTPGGTGGGGVGTPGSPVVGGDDLGQTPGVTTTGPVDSSLNPPATVGQTPPQVAGQLPPVKAVADDTYKKLKWLALALLVYPALLILVRLVSALAGGWMSAPPRLPRSQ